MEEKSGSKQAVNIDITAHKVVDSFTSLIEMLFTKSPVVGNIATIIIVSTPIYYLHIRNTVGRTEKLNDKKLKDMVSKEIAKRAKKRKKSAKKGGKA